MPLLQRIEVSNFLNSRRIEPWRPDWLHQIIDLNGQNTAINIPNGKGKTTLFKSVLALLLHDMKVLNDVRERFFVPNPSVGQTFTHIRIQVLIPVHSTSSDMFASAGAEVGGEPMVFGMYGYGFRESKLETYSYQGTFEDCPVAAVYKIKHTLTRNQDFLEQLKQCRGLFPSNKKEDTKREWLKFVETYFDIASLRQQYNYQLLKGAEGGRGYFEVHVPSTMDYSAGVFYERLAPELLVGVMGDLGEDGERGIEDTIHEKVSKVIRARHITESKAKELRRAENTLKEFEDLLETANTLRESKEAHGSALEAYSLEKAALQDAVIDHPMPGIPRIPPDSVPTLARSMVLQGGQWFIPDRVIAEFTGESSSDVNRRAQERNGLPLEQASRSQLIDFPCHLAHSIMRKGGHSNQLYSRETAQALLKITNNFTGDWTQEKAAEVVNQSFNWVERHADTNPARTLRFIDDAHLSRIEAERTALNETLKAQRDRMKELEREQARMSGGHQEYRRAQSSGLFTPDELNTPKDTEIKVKHRSLEARTSLDNHRRRMARLDGIHQSWKQYVDAYGASDSPGQRADELENARDRSKQAMDQAISHLREARKNERNQREHVIAALRLVQTTEDRLHRYCNSGKSLARFRSIFGDISPVGLTNQVTNERDQARSRKTAIQADLGRMADGMQAFSRFRQAHGSVDPTLWLEERQASWERLGGILVLLQDELKEAHIQRESLNKAVIVAGKVTREASAIAGEGHLSLHEVVSQLSVDAERRTRILIMFSALLHAPVFPTVEAASEAAARLERAGVEAPVFVRPALEDFLKTGEITWDANKAHTWLLGIRTRQVEVLLDPTLVEREKIAADERIATLDNQIIERQKERSRHAPESDDARDARDAQKAIRHDWPQKQSTLSEEINKIDSHLPNLEQRASQEVIRDILAVEQLHKEFGGLSENDLQAEFDEATRFHATAKAQLEITEALISGLETKETELRIKFQQTFEASGHVKEMRAIQLFIDHPEDNPDFMWSASETERRLDAAYQVADERTRFDFPQIDLFVKDGEIRFSKIREEMAALDAGSTRIQDRLIPDASTEIERLKGNILFFKSQETEIDQFAGDLIRRYRGFLADQVEAKTAPHERVGEHPLSIALNLARDSMDAASTHRFIEAIRQVDLSNSTEMREAMRASSQTLNQVEREYALKVDKALSASEVEMSEHVRTELLRSKTEPVLVKHLHRVTLDNYTKNKAANAIAENHLQEEWENISSWLEAFTLRLPENLSLMKKVFAPKINKETGEFISGFTIEATLADRGDIRSVLDEVVRMVEKFDNYEASNLEMNGVITNMRDRDRRALRDQIRTTFYQKIILNPRIKLFMPSLSHREILITKDMVSTGQGVAMTLLWIVKMGKYVSERELRSMITSRVQQNRVYRTQFVLIDGAFSSLSDEGLIRDALNTVDTTRGNFQLIISGHDETYRNNFEYFPVLVSGRVLDGSDFVYTDVITKQIIDPSEVGAHYGVMETISMRVKHAQSESESH